MGCDLERMPMSTRKMDRWWAIIIAFLVAAGMVLLVILAMEAGPNDGAARTLRPVTHTTARVAG